MIDIIALQALFGASIPISKKLLSYSPPFFLAGSRLFLAGIVLLAYNQFYKKRNYKKLESIYLPKQSKHPFYCFEKVLNA